MWFGRRIKFGAYLRPCTRIGAVHAMDKYNIFRGEVIMISRLRVGYCMYIDVLDWRESAFWEKKPGQIIIS